MSELAKHICDFRVLYLVKYIGSWVMIACDGQQTFLTVLIDYATAVVYWVLSMFQKFAAFKSISH